MKEINLVFKFGLIFLLLFHVNCTPRLANDLSLNDKIICSLNSKSDSFGLLEDVYLYFTVTNTSEKEIYIDNRPNGFYVYGKPIDLFSVKVIDENGVIIKPNKFRLTNFSGRYGIVKVEPNKSLEIRLNILDYANINKIGKYQVTIHKELSVYLNKRKRLRNNEFKNYKKFIKASREVNQEIEIKEENKTP